MLKDNIIFNYIIEFSFAGWGLFFQRIDMIQYLDRNKWK